MRAQSASLALILAVSTLTGAAHASPVAPYVSTDADGDPLLFSWTAALSAPTTWRACPPSESCVALATAGYELRPGPTAPGTRFENSIAWPGGIDTWSSPVWGGPLVEHSPPTLSGLPVVGASVMIQPGSASGGWVGGVRELLVLCRAADGTWCEDFTANALTSAHVGSYLFAVRRHGGPAPYGAYDLRARSPASTSGPYGPVTAAPSPVATAVDPVRTAAPAAGPILRLRDRALRSQGRLSVGRITCAVACKVSVKVSGGGEKASTTTFLARGTQPIRVAARRGRLTVRVHVDGKLLANAKVTAR